MNRNPSLHLCMQEAKRLSMETCTLYLSFEHLNTYHILSGDLSIHGQSCTSLAGLYLCCVVVVSDKKLILKYILSAFYCHMDAFSYRVSEHTACNICYTLIIILWTIKNMTRAGYHDKRIIMITQLDNIMLTEQCLYVHLGFDPASLAKFNSELYH